MRGQVDSALPPHPQQCWAGPKVAISRQAAIKGEINLPFGALAVTVQKWIRQRWHLIRLSCHQGYVGSC